jgi:hypothetical protein
LVLKHEPKLPRFGDRHAIRNGNGGKWWGGSDEVVILGCCFWLHKQGGWVLGQKSKTKPLGFSFKCAIKNSGRR